MSKGWVLAGLWWTFLPLLLTYTFSWLPSACLAGVHRPWSNAAISILLYASRWIGFHVNKQIFASISVLLCVLRVIWLPYFSFAISFLTTLYEGAPKSEQICSWRFCMKGRRNPIKLARGRFIHSVGTLGTLHAINTTLELCVQTNCDLACGMSFVREMCTCAGPRVPPQNVPVLALYEYAGHECLSFWQYFA